MYRLTGQSQPYDRATVDVSFIEFTTGAIHPLSSKPTVRLQSPLNPVPTVVGLEAEVLGDYILIAVTYEYTGCYVSLISWKTGTTTVVSGVLKLFLSHFRPE